MRPTFPKSTDKNLELPETIAETPTRATTQFADECWFDDTCILDMDYFVKTLAGIKAKGVNPNLIGSIITHYASKWLPDLSSDDSIKVLNNVEDSPESLTASWMKKRFFIETLVGILPPEKDSVSCNFLLRVLRVANMVGVEPAYRVEIEKRIAWQLDQASLKELMIPAFTNTCGTLLDIELVHRLVKRFLTLDEAAKSGAALVKVAKLIDCYLAEAAVDANMTLLEFIALGGALPRHARASDDGLYRAVDTYLKAHPNTSKQERKTICQLIDIRKLSPEATLHASQNERLPVRAVIQVLFSEHMKLNRQSEQSGSFSGVRSPNPTLETPTRCLSKRQMTAQQVEIQKLQEDVMRLQSQCTSMQAQIEKLLEKKSFFRWRKLSKPLFRHTGTAERVGEGCSGEAVECQTPVETKGKLVQSRKTPNKWRNSVS